MNVWPFRIGVCLAWVINNWMRKLQNRWWICRQVRFMGNPSFVIINNHQTLMCQTCPLTSTKQHNSSTFQKSLAIRKVSCYLPGIVCASLIVSGHKWLAPLHVYVRAIWRALAFHRFSLSVMNRAVCMICCISPICYTWNWCAGSNMPILGYRSNGIPFSRQWCGRSGTAAPSAMNVAIEIAVRFDDSHVRRYGGAVTWRRKQRFNLF